MVDKHKRRYETVEYKQDDNVSVRMGYGGKKSTPNRKFVIEGKILKKGKHSDNYKVLLIPLVKSMPLNCVSQTSATDANRTNACDKSHRSK